MSDPMTRTDIEDVLSSIRRLVSEEGRAGAGQRASGAAARQAAGPTPVPPTPVREAAPGPERARGPASDVASDPGATPLPLTARIPRPTPRSEPGRLVLTPALRVAGSEDDGTDQDAAATRKGQGHRDEVADNTPPEVEEAPMSVDVPEDWAEGASDKVSVLRLQDAASRAIQSTIAELEAAVAERVDQWDPEGTAEIDYDENHSNAFDGPVRFVHRAPLRLRDRVTDDPAPQPVPEVDGEAEAAKPADAALPDEAEAAAAFHSARAELRPAPELDAPEETAAEPEAVTEPEPVAEAEAVAEPEPEVVTEPEPEVEPEAAAAPEEEPYLTAEPFAGFDAATLEDVAETGAGQGAAKADAGLFDEADAGYLDEDALREIVRDMIRQELQGSLGERITRNVRKLVRAEINRALASRDFQ